MRTVLVEDSQDNLEILRHFIEKYCPQLEIVGTAGTLEDAERELRIKQPDLVFFDIVLEDRNSFELLEKLENEADISFLIVFVTAHPRFEFAEKAIDYSAVGYLTKPLDKHKLIATVHKAIKLHPIRSLTTIKEMLEQMSTATQPPSPFFKIYKVNQFIKTVSIDEISHISSDRDLTRVYLTTGEEIHSSRSLSFYQQRLEDHPGFFRIHNSTLVNINQISELNKKDNLVFMRTGMRLNCSRRMGRALYDYLQGD